MIWKMWQGHERNKGDTIQQDSMAIDCEFQIYLQYPCDAISMSFV